MPSNDLTIFPSDERQKAAQRMRDVRTLQRAAQTLGRSGRASH
jgi:hypothetical protein